MSQMLKIVLIALVIMFTNHVSAKPQKDKMKLRANQSAPVFTSKDVYGKIINLSDLKGKKVLLTFYRNVGCPICNFRFHELQMQQEYFKSKGITLISVYESSSENMKKYLGDETFYGSMIPDTSLSLYNLYSMELSMGKIMKGMFKGAMGKMMKGKKLFKTKIAQDGNTTRIGADFLIDENGFIQIAYYGKFLGDHISVEEIKKLLN